MKKQLLLKPLLALALVLVCGNAWGQDAAPQGTTLWGEDFSSFLSGSTLTENPSQSGASTVVYGNGTINYSYANGGGTTKLYTGTMSAGGTAPEILIAKSNGSFTAANIPTGGAKVMTLTFNSNKTSFAVTTSSDAYTVNGSEKSWTFTLNESATSPDNFDITIKQTGTSNSRVDNINLVVTATVNGVSEPTFSKESSSFFDAFDLTISCETSDATIYYTTDGTDPTNASTAYSGAIQISSTTTVKAIAVKEGMGDSGVATATYTLGKTYANLEALVAAGTPTGETVRVTLANETIKSLVSTNGIMLQATTEKQIEIYKSDRPEDWVAGGTVSGTLTCPWKVYSGTWELCPTDWKELTYSAPKTYNITINSTSNGEVTANMEKAAADVIVTLTVTPNTHYVLSTLSVTKSTGGSVPLADDKTFIMPACDVTVSATFKELDKFSVKYYSANKLLSEETVYKGEAIAEAPNLTAPSGWTFVGWTEENDYTGSSTSPEMFEGIVTGETELYAVYKKGEENIVYTRVEADQTDWRGDYLIAYSDEVFMNGSLQGGEDGVGKTLTYKSAITALSTDKKIISKEWGDKYYVIIEAINDADLSKGYVIRSHSETTPYFYQTSNKNGMSATNNKSTAASYPLSITFVSSNDIKISIPAGAVLHYNANASGLMFRFYKDGGQNPVYLYKRTDVGTYTYATNVYEASISSAKYATLCLPFKYTVPEGVTAYTGEATNDGVTLSAIDGVVPANTGVIIYSETPGTYTFTGSAETPASIVKNDLVGVTETTTIPEGSYILALDTDDTAKFFEIDPKDNELAAYKAYLAIPEGVTPSKALAIRRGDATGIRTIEAQAANQYFDLMGRKVQDPERGIYILNGKKVYVK